MNIFALYALLVGIGFASGTGITYKWMSHELDKQNALIHVRNEEAKLQLEVLTEKTRKQEQENTELANTLEKLNDEANKTITNLSNELSATRLRGNRACRKSSSSAVSKDKSTGASTEKAGDDFELSEEFEGFLKREALRADLAASYASSCYNFVQSITNKLIPTGDKS